MFIISNMPWSDDAQILRYRGVLTTDLNLLKVFHAIYCERHLTRAGEAIGLSQPAMSRALARLREIFNDRLFVRTQDGMVPTARAILLADSVRQSLAHLQEALATVDRFDPTTSSTTFRLGVNDYVSTLLLPEIVARIATQAPGVNVRASHASYRTSEEQLDSGAIDLAILANTGQAARFEGERLFTESYMCVIAADNPHVGEELDLGTFARLRHVLVTHAGDDRGWVDQALAERGLRRRVAVTVPHFGAAPLIVADSDMIATVPSRIAACAAARMRLRVLPPPIPSLAHQFIQVWHCRQSRNASHQWLRQIIRDCCSTA